MFAPGVNYDPVHQLQGAVCLPAPLCIFPRRAAPRSNTFCVGVSEHATLMGDCWTINPPYAPTGNSSGQPTTGTLAGLENGFAVSPDMAFDPIPTWQMPYHNCSTTHFSAIQCDGPSPPLHPVRPTARHPDRRRLAECRKASRPIRTGVLFDEFQRCVATLRLSCKGAHARGAGRSPGSVLACISNR